MSERESDQFILDRGKENAFRNSERGVVRNRRREDSATEAKKESSRHANVHNGTSQVTQKF